MKSDGFVIAQQFISFKSNQNSIRADSFRLICGIPSRDERRSAAQKRNARRVFFAILKMKTKDERK